MTDVAEKLYTLLVAATAAGQPLNTLAGRVYREAMDLRPGVQHSLPLLYMEQVASPRTLDVVRGSRYEVMEGSIRVGIYVAVDPRAERGHEEARESAETLWTALMRVLVGNRQATSTDNPASCWHDLRVVQDDGGGGPGEFAGKSAWGRTADVVIRFRRLRAA